MKNDPQEVWRRLEEQRIWKTVKNLVYTWSGYFVVVLCTFVGWTFFVEIIGTAYLGAGALFSSMLACLNLADLGLGAAVTYSLYQPLAEHDKEKIAAILSMFHKVYKIVGIVVGTVGFLLTPFLDFFINDIPGNIRYGELQVYYLLFVINNAVGYFLYYKSVLFLADQKQYVVEVNYSICMAAMTVTQIVILAVSKSYFWYLIIQIVFTIVRNMAISIIADKNYPYIKRKQSYRISKHDRNKLVKSVGGRMFQKVGAVIVNSTDNVIISKFIDISTVGIYGNYNSIISTLGLLLNQVFQSALASVGNFNVTADRRGMADIFEKSLFINFWIYGFTGISLICLLNPLMQIWLGQEYLLSQNLVWILGVNFYLNGMRQTSLMFADAMGLYWENRYKPVFEALVNLLLSLVFVRFFGMNGIFLGTTCSIVFVCMWTEPYIIFKYAFALQIRYYFVSYMKYFSVVVCAGCSAYFLCMQMTDSGILYFLEKMFVCVIVINAEFYVFFRKHDAFRFYCCFVRKFLQKKKFINKL